MTAALAKCFSDHGHQVSIACFCQPNPQMVARLDKRVHTFTLGEFCYSNYNVRRLREILVQESVNVVINQWGLPYIPAKVLSNAKKGLDIKTIAVYHNSPDTNARIKGVEIALENASNPMKRWLLCCKRFVFRQVTSRSMRYVYNQSDLYMVLSPSFIEKFKTFTGIRHPDHLIVQTNPVTIDASDYIFSPDIKQKEVLYVGRIDYNQKRVQRIIKTWALLENDFPEWKLTIVGDGPERQNLEHLVSDLKLKNVSFEGFQSPESYYQRASILVLTSEYEGFGLVIVEAMSYGVVPVVLGSYSAVYDILEDWKDGIILPYDKSSGFQSGNMAERMACLMGDDDKREAVARNSILASKKYSIGIIYEQWENVFKTLFIS